MGTVYRAEHLALGRPVALKVLRAAHGARTDLVQRFQREAVAAGQIRHPGIVEVLDFGRTPEGRFYLSMELVDGETLARPAVADRSDALPTRRWGWCGTSPARSPPRTGEASSTAT